MTDTTAGDPERTTTAAEISEHERCRLLADERRRVAADVLAEQSSPLTLAELAVAVNTRETGRESESQRAVEVRLHHVHLPLMADVGVLNYDPEANRIEPWPSKLDALTE